MLISQFLTFAAIIAYTVFSCRQSQAMFDANRLAQQNTKDTLSQSKALAEGAIRTSRDQAEAALKESRRQSEAALKRAQENATTEQGLTRDGLAQSRAALEVSRGQMTQSLRQLESTDRPWVTIAFPQFAAFQFHEAGDASLGLTYTLKNIGRSPAVNIEVHAIVIPLAPKDWLTGPFIWQKQTCKPSLMAPDSPRGFSLVPAEEISVGFSTTLDAQSIAAASVPPGPGDVDGGVMRFLPVLVGCVTYSFANSLKMHSTGFIYSIERRTPNDPHANLVRAYPNGSSEDVELTRFFFGGQRSD